MTSRMATGMILSQLKLLPPSQSLQWRKRKEEATGAESKTKDVKATEKTKKKGKKVENFVEKKREISVLKL